MFRHEESEAQLYGRNQFFICEQADVNFERLQFGEASS